MGVLGVLVGATVALGQSPLTVLATRFESLTAQSQLDQITDMETWQNPATLKTYVFITGWMSGPAGGKVFGTYRYTVGDFGDFRFHHWPTQWQTETREHKAVALAVDQNENSQSFGYVYVTGSSEKPDGTTDYITIRYQPDLTPDPYWHDPGEEHGVRRYDGPEHGNDTPTDIIVYNDGTEGRVVVTGTSWGGPEHQEDIATVSYRVSSGANPWVDRYDGPAHGTDLAAELVVARVYQDGPGGGTGVAVFVSGTSAGLDDSGDSGFDAVAIALNPDGTRRTSWLPDPEHGFEYGWGYGVRRYDGPAHGDELVTGIAGVTLTHTTPGPIVLCGSVPRNPPFPGDTEYLLWSLNAGNGNAWWSSHFGYGPGVRIYTGGGVTGPDVARDAVIEATGGAEFRLWTTGEVSTSGIDVGTVLFRLDLAGELEAEHVFTSGYHNENDTTRDFGLKIIQHSPGRAYVAGWTEDTAWGGLADFLTLSFLRSPVIFNLEAWTTYDAAMLEDKGFGAAYAPNPASLLVGGRSHAGQPTGPDYLLIRYSP